MYAVYYLGLPEKEFDSLTWALRFVAKKMGGILSTVTDKESTLTGWSIQLIRRN